MPSWIIRQLRNAAPLTIIILSGVFTQKWWQPYLTSSSDAQSVAQSQQSLTKESKSDDDNDDNNDVTPAARGSKIAFQPAELTSLESKTLTPLPNETPPPKEDAPFLPNRKTTPGAIFTQATREIICVPGYTKKVRNVPVGLKKDVYNAYGIKHHIKGEYEVDHLVSLELGGSNDVTNLWPEPYQGSMNAHEKDKAENAAHKAVCARRITLREAQEQMSKDWVVLYRRLVEEHP